jgi:dienelactone hydrolase
MVPRHTATRRTVVAALAAALSGCASSEDPSSSETTANGTSTEADEPTRTEATTDTPESPEAVARALVTRLNEGAFRAATDLFDDTLSRQVSATRLQRIWTRLESSLGPFEEITAVERRSDPPRAEVIVRVAFENGGRAVRVVVDDESAIAGLLFLEPYSAPEYVDRSALSEREVTLDGDCALGATLSVPDGDGPFPGVVIVHGSGPQDRDGTIGVNKVYQDLAWGLASEGVAVLRYDKRTDACSVPPSEETVDSVITDDALAAIAKLRDVNAVRPDGVTAVGHSLGGAVVPRIAERDGDLAGIAMLAGNARAIYRLLPEQNRYIAELDGTVTDAERERIEGLEEAVRRLDEGDVDPDETIAGRPARFWLSLKEYDQVETAANLDVPRLVCQGRRDWQVSPEADFERWRSALGDEATYRLYDRLNHLFMTGEGQSTPVTQIQTGNVAETVVGDVATWLGDEA